MGITTPIRADILDSRTPDADAVKLGADWAVFRDATADERSALGIGDRFATVVLLRSCARVQVFVLWHDNRPADEPGRALPAVPPINFEQGAVPLDHLASAFVFSLIAGLAPIAVLQLGEERPAARCQGCRCLWSDDGPFQPDSAVAVAIREWAAKFDGLRRIIA